MQYRDEAQLRHLRERVEEELAQARAEVEAAKAEQANAVLRKRLDEIEQELTKLRNARGVLFRGRRRQAELNLLLSERLVLDELGASSYEEYVARNKPRPTAVTNGGPATGDLAPLERALDDGRISDIENGVLDLDWLAGGAREIDGFDPTQFATVAQPATDAGEEAGRPLEAWRNPLTDPAANRNGLEYADLPRIEKSDPLADLPYWTESA
jgi:hypothetical protein